MAFPKLTGFIVSMLLVLLQTTLPSYSQDSLYDYGYWVKKLSVKNDQDNRAYYGLFDFLTKTNKDSATIFNFLNQIERSAKSPNAYFEARFLSMKAWLKIIYHQYRSISEINTLVERTLTHAYETDDDAFIAFITIRMGTQMVGLQEMERAATYIIKGQEIFDRLGNQSVRDQYSNYVVIGEVLFHCREYEKSIYYTRKVIEIYNDTISNSDYFRARFNNTMGQNYEQLGMLDSALYYYETSLQLARKVNDDPWKGINSGFIGQVFIARKQTDSAKPYLQYAYNINKTREVDHAARALQWLARIDLEEGRKDSALFKVKEAKKMLERAGPGYYIQPIKFLELVYYTTADVYRSMGNSDSFYRYNQLYTNLHDSLSRLAILSSAKVAQLKIDNENNYRAIQLLEREKRTADLRRNFLIVAILLVLVIVFMYINRLRLKQRHKEQIVLEQKKVAEAELLSAREQMQLFTENIIEKSNLIEKLNTQIMNKEMSVSQQGLLEEITHQTILTEDDWENFKSLFEKIYPGFFMHLKEKARDITIAEQRMAALTRLNLTTRQMASMLGISVDSVHKTRQRLRQRLHIPAEMNLEDSVSTF